MKLQEFYNKHGIVEKAKILKEIQEEVSKRNDGFSYGVSPTPDWVVMKIWEEKIFWESI